MSTSLRTADRAGLQAWVQAHGPSATLAVPHAQAKALLDEIRRLEQSSGLLRKQNAKLRARLQRLGAEADDEAESAGAGEALENP